MVAQLKLIQEGKENSVDREKALEAALAQIDRAFGKGSRLQSWTCRFLCWNSQGFEA